MSNGEDSGNNNHHDHHHHSDSQKGANNGGGSGGVSNKYISKEFYLDISKLEGDFSRADIEILNVDHSGASYEGRLFLNNPDATQTTELTLENGYVGSYHIFGHGGCFGGEGHCEIPSGRRRLYDHRPDHHLRPQYKRIIITDALKKIGKEADKFTITIIAVSYGSVDKSSESTVQNTIKFDKMGIITYT